MDLNTLVLAKKDISSGLDDAIVGKSIQNQTMLASGLLQIQCGLLLLTKFLNEMTKREEEEREKKFRGLFNKRRIEY